MLQFVLGASGTGKTTFIHDKIKMLSKEEQAKILLIVPEQFTYETEKTLFQKLGAQQFMRIQVTSFTRFASEIFHQFGGVAGEYVSEPAKVVLMDMALRAVKDELSVYAKTAGYKSFPFTMIETVSELKNAGVTAKKLLSACEQLEEGYLKDKTKEIALIFETYNALLYQSFQDSLDDISRAAHMLKATDYFKGYTVFFDEFKGFTANENDLLKMIFCQADMVYVSLCLDLERANQSDVSLFASVKDTYQRLMRLTRQVETEIKTSVTLCKQYRFQNRALSHLERNIFSPVVEPFSEEQTAIHVISCKNEYDEVDFVLGQIVDLIQKQNYRYQDIAIISRALDTYMTKLTVGCEKYHIPYYSDMRGKITHKPLIRFVENMLRCVTDGYQSEDILSMLKCGLLPFSVEDISELENYIYIWGINGRKWFSAFTLHPKGYKENFENKDTELLEKLNVVRAFAVDGLKKFEQQTKNNNGKSICFHMISLLKEFRLQETIQKMIETFYRDEKIELAEEYTRLWEIFMQLIDILAKTIGETPVTLREFSQLYQLVCDSYDMGALPQSLDCVLIGDAKRVRLSDKKAVFILGVNENVMPYVPNSSGVFTDKEREALIELEIEISPPVKQHILEERFIAYKTLCSPTEQLWLTARKADIAGRPLMASMLFWQLKQMFGADIITDTEQLSSVSYCKTKETAFAHLAKTYQENTVLKATLKQVLSEEEEYTEKINALERVLKKEPFHIHQTSNAKQLFGKEMKISPTRVDSFYQCHFRYFCEHGLRIQPLRRAELNPMETGTLIHSVLYTITKNNDLKNAYDEKEIKQQIKKELDSYLEKIMGGAEEKSKRFLYLYQRMQQSIFKIVARLRAELEQSDFEPCEFEYDIQEDSEITPLVLRTVDGTRITVAGKVDRIDRFVNNKGEKYIRIVDYKSGKKQFKLNDVLYGINLQMLIYLFCIQNNGRGKYADSLPAGILYMPAGEQNPTLSRNATENDMQCAITEQYRMNGLLLMEDEVLEAMEHGKKGIFIPVTTKKNGDFDSKTLNCLATLKELGRINRYIDKLIIDMATELHVGNIEASPLENSCDYCSYNGICFVGKEDQQRDCVKYNREQIMEQMNVEKGEENG